jgi:hypothetical protein
MFRRLLVFATLLALPAFAQTGASGESGKVTASVGRSRPMGEIVMHITPTVEMWARHCEKYSIPSGGVDTAACEADDSTLFQHQINHNTQTTASFDLVASALFCTSAGNCATRANPMIYIALGNSATPGDCAPGNTPPSTGQCTMTGELSTNGLARATATDFNKCTSLTSGVCASNTWGSSGTFVTVDYTWTDTTASTSNVQASALIGGNGGGACTTAGNCEYAWYGTWGALTLNVNDTIKVSWTITLTIS